MLTDTSLNATQLLGMLVFFIAAVCTFWSARRSARTKERTLWFGIGITQALFFLEVWLGFRHSVHDLVNAALQSLDLYRDRAVTQTVILLALCILGVALIMMIWRSAGRQRQTSGAAKLALACTAGLGLLFLVETISLHAIDRILYFPLGPVLLIAWVWAVLALVVIVLTFGSPSNSTAEHERRR